MNKLFVYGTLRSKDTLRAVLKRQSNIPKQTEARLSGYLKRGLNIIPHAPGVVDGYLMEVSDSDLALLDIYECVATGLYKKIPVTVEVSNETDVTKQVEAIAYVLVDLTY